jgi:multidrug resistance efflux pump
MIRNPRLRLDIIIRPSAELEGVYYLKDPILDAYYEANILQYEILTRLDGKHPLEQIAREISKVFEVEVSASDLAGYLEELQRRQLLDQAGPDIRSDELRREVGRVARTEIQKQGFSLDERKSEAVGRRPRSTLERALFSKALAALVADEITEALRHFSAILDVNPLNGRARVFARVIRESLIKTRQRYSKEDSRIINARRIRLYDPDRMLAAIDRRIGWLLFNRVFVVLTIALSLVATYIAVADGSELLHSFTNLAVTHPATVVAASYILSFLFLFLHENQHGLVLKHYGGTVRETGIALVNGMPGAYCDVSDAYFLTRKHRVLVVLGGLINDMLFWAIWVIVWRITEPNTVINICGLLFSSMNTVMLVVNLVPVVKNDGYYLLVEILEMPNLQDSARLYYQSVFASYLSGNRVLEDADSRQRKIYLYYVPMWALRITYLLGFYIGVIGDYLVSELRVWGLIIFLVLLIPLLRARYREGFGSCLSMLRGAIAVDPSRFWKPVRVAVVFLAPLGLLAGLLMVPWEAKITAWTSLEPKQLAQVRSQVPGQVTGVDRREGEWVGPGQSLAKMDRAELEARQRQILATIAAVDARLRLAKVGTRQEKIALLRERVDRRSTQVAFAARRYEQLRRLASASAVTMREAEVAGRELAARENEREQALAALRKEQAVALPETIAALEAERAKHGVEASLITERLARTDLHSPIGGTVLTPHLEELVGAYLSRGQLFCEVADLRRMLAVATVNRNDLQDLRKGALMKVKLWGAFEETRFCHVEHIAEKPRQKHFEIRCLLADSRGLLPNMTGKVEVFTGRRRVAELLLRPVKRMLTVDFWSFF